MSCKRQLKTFHFDNPPDRSGYQAVDGSEPMLKEIETFLKGYTPFCEMHHENYRRLEFMIYNRAPISELARDHHNRNIRLFRFKTGYQLEEYSHEHNTMLKIMRKLDREHNDKHGTYSTEPMPIGGYDYSHWGKGNQEK